MSSYRFTYATDGAGASISRDEAVDRLSSKAGSVVVTLYPGPTSVQIEPGGLGSPYVVPPGWGHLPASRAEKAGHLMIEAAALAAEAEE